MLYFLLYIDSCVKAIANPKRATKWESGYIHMRDFPLKAMLVKYMLIFKNEH